MNWVHLFCSIAMAQRGGIASNWNAPASAAISLALRDYSNQHNNQIVEPVHINSCSQYGDVYNMNGAGICAPPQKQR
jgi:hypothetical protein